MPRRVVVLCFEGAELLDLAGPSNVLTAASRLAPGARGYDVQLAACKVGPVATAGGSEVMARQKAGELCGPLDTLLVPGTSFYPAEKDELVEVIRRLSPQARRTVGVCTGAMLLAEAGLLAGRRAATHWAACDRLRQDHPRCQVEDDAIFVRDGAIWTSAGVTAGMDLALALVEQDHGPQLALEVARWLVMYLRRPGGQSQFSAPLAAQTADRSPIQQLIDWIPDNLSANLSVPALAARAGMSERTFARTFNKQTGQSPAAWTMRVRLEAVRRALESSRRSVKELAACYGFSSPEALHRAFRRSVGTTPLAYRRRFRIDDDPSAGHTPTVTAASATTPS